MEEQILEYPVAPEAKEDLAEINKPVEGEEGAEVAPLSDSDWGRALLVIVQEDNRSQMFVRETNMRKWRKHHLYWDNMQYLAWSEVAHDWMTAEDIVANDPQAD